MYFFPCTYWQVPCIFLYTVICVLYSKALLNEITSSNCSLCPVQRKALNSSSGQFTSDDWEKKVDGLTSTHALARQHPQSLKAILCKVRVTVIQVKNLCSCAAMASLGVIYARLQKAVDDMTEEPWWWRCLSLSQLTDILRATRTLSGGKTFAMHVLTAVSKVRVDAAADVRHHGHDMLQKRTTTAHTQNSGKRCPRTRQTFAERTHKDA